MEIYKTACQQCPHQERIAYVILPPLLLAQWSRTTQTDHSTAPSDDV